MAQGFPLLSPHPSSVICQLWFLTCWTLPTSLWASPCFGNVKELLWDHLWPPPCAALSPPSVNTVSYAPFPLPRGATLLDWPLRARYVNNVFFLGPTHMLHTDSFKAIAQPFFYGRPLEMEYVTDETLLGFVLSTSQRTITFRQPPHRSHTDPQQSYRRFSMQTWLSPVSSLGAF